MAYTLISDVGGTNIRLSIKGEDINHEDFIQSYKCADFENIEYALLKYLATIDAKYYPSMGIFAVAAPISGDYIELSNNHWKFSLKDLAQKTNMSCIKVVNDFEAQAYALEFLQDKDLHTLKSAKAPRKNGTRLIVGPGTGLGVSLLHYSAPKWNVLATEAGHSIIGSYSKLEQDVFDFLKQDTGKESYAELVVSGRGIENIYKALCHILEVNYDESLTSKDITENALKSEDKACVYSKTLDLFFAFFATFVSSISGAMLPYDGVYITGGIIPNLIKELESSVFLERYLDRSIGSIVDILEHVDIHIVIRDNPALFGLAHRKDLVVEDCI